MTGKYTLAEDGKTPLPCEDIMEWARWFGSAARHVADDTANGVRVSTVFLGMDHAFGGGPPVLWETLVFGLPDEDGERYTSHDDAVAGHARYVAKYHTQEPARDR